MCEAEKREVGVHILQKNIGCRTCESMASWTHDIRCISFHAFPIVAILRGTSVGRWCQETVGESIGYKISGDSKVRLEAQSSSCFPSEGCVLKCVKRWGIQKQSHGAKASSLICLQVWTNQLGGGWSPTDPETAAGLS